MMKSTITQIMLSPLLALMFLLVIIAGCEKSSIQDTLIIQKKKPHRLDIGMNELMNYADMEVSVTPRSHGYIAEARGRGIIPSGEYAGQRFQITLEGNYSDIGFETLESGEAVVTIRSDRFESVYDTTLQSFCCGEGHLQIVDSEYEFTMFGQVTHDAGGPHNHLFAGLANTAGFMNMNIADQTGTVVEQMVPPHDPGIGLILGFDAMYVRVDLH